MQVILREDVDHLGSRGDVVRVAAGYGRNYLIPRGLAVKITPGNLKQIDHEKKILLAKKKKDMAAAEGLKSRVEACELTFRRKVGESDTLYGSVTNADVAEALAEHGLTIDKRKVVITEPIKSLGNFSVPVKLHREVQAKVKVYVVREDPDPAPALEPEPEPVDDDEDED